MSGLRSGVTVALSRAGLVLALTAVLVVGSVSPVGALAGYGDVGGGTWYTDAVQWSVDNGIADISGFCFGPETPVSRGETAVWIYNMENQPDAGEGHPFTDVTDASQDDAVSWMADNEITTGTSPTTFAPDETLRRAQVATFLYRLKGEPSAPPHSFSDVVAGWQQDAVSWMAHTGITTGTSPTTFAPKDTLTRGHLVTFLYRYQGEPEVTVSASTPPCNPNNIPGYNPDTFYTERNQASVFVKEEVIDKYAEDNPWLLRAWNHTNRPDFEYKIDYTYPMHIQPAGIHSRHSGEELDKITTIRFSMDDLRDNAAFVHELAHVYTLANGISARPEALAAAHLYFADLSSNTVVGNRCPGYELYADTAQLLVPTDWNTFAPYWHKCEHLPSLVTSEAEAVVRSAFNDEIPQWYDTFTTPSNELTAVGITRQYGIWLKPWGIRSG